MLTSSPSEYTKGATHGSVRDQRTPPVNASNAVSTAPSAEPDPTATMPPGSTEIMSPTSSGHVDRTLPSSGDRTITFRTVAGTRRSPPPSSTELSETNPPSVTKHATSVASPRRTTSKAPNPGAMSLTQLLPATTCPGPRSANAGAGPARSAVHCGPPSNHVNDCDPSAACSTLPPAYPYIAEMSSDEIVRAATRVSPTGATTPGTLASSATAARSRSTATPCTAPSTTTTPTTPPTNHRAAGRRTRSEEAPWSAPGSGSPSSSSSTSCSSSRRVMAGHYRPGRPSVPTSPLARPERGEGVG